METYPTFCDRISVRRLTIYLITILSVLLVTPAAGVDLTRYPQLTEMVDTLTSQHALDRDQVLGWLAQAKINQKVLAAMKRPSERLPWHRYRQLFVTKKTI